MGVDTAKFPFSHSGKRHNAKAQLLTVARLVEKKGVEFAIRAVAEVITNYPHIEYKIAGDGPLANNLQALIDRLNINDKVTILGFQRQDQVANLMKNADLFLAPSVTSQDGDIEGIPVVIMEAMARGLPVLSTLHSGIPELVEDGKSGFLVQERDPMALAEKLTYLLQHQDLWSRMGAAGRDFIERNHNIDKLNDQLVQVFDQLLCSNQQ
ncbi:MAG: glycosyltransferase [Planctomycetota bacterium]|jgi:colanic acid/amylovoran biosynthesis glycosyltransferase